MIFSATTIAKKEEMAKEKTKLRPCAFCGRKFAVLGGREKFCNRNCFNLWHKAGQRSVKGLLMNLQSLEKFCRWASRELSKGEKDNG
jgi:hypothetical protein